MARHVGEVTIGLFVGAEHAEPLEAHAAEHGHDRRGTNAVQR